MTGLEVVLAVAGLTVFVMVIVAMILIVPSGTVDGPAGTTDPVPPARVEV